MNRLVFLIAIFNALSVLGLVTFAISFIVSLLGCDDFSGKTMRSLAITALVSLMATITFHIGYRIALFRFDEKVATYQLLGDDYIKTKGIVALIEKLEGLDKDGLIEVLDVATGNKRGE